MIQCRDLSAGYGDRAVLSGVDLAFEPGCVTVLIGPNGCGKTTLLKTVLGLLPPVAGRVLYDGADLAGLPPRPGRPKGRLYAPKPSGSPDRGAADGAARAVPVSVLPAAVPQRGLCRRWMRPWPPPAHPTWPAG